MTRHVQARVLCAGLFEILPAFYHFLYVVILREDNVYKLPPYRHQHPGQNLTA